MRGMEGRSTFIPFGRPNLGTDEIEAITRVLQSGWIGHGPEVEEFEKELGNNLQAEHVVSVSSCTAALHLALLLLNIGPGDEVIVPSLTWCSTANAVLYVGARPVFCDIDPHTLTADLDDIVSRITSKTKAVIVVHFGGRAVDIEELRKKLPSRINIVEDAAHALGGRYWNGEPIGSSENICCFSFYANKNITTGEGGALVTCRPQLAESARSLRQHGLATNAWKRFSNAKVSVGGAIVERLGYKMNFTDLQAALGRAQLKRLADFQRRRLEVARHFVQALKGYNIVIQEDILSPYHARHLFPIRLSDVNSASTRNEMISELRTRGVGAAVHYAPLHMMPLYNCDYHLPQTERFYQSTISLPISASLTDEEVDHITEQMGQLLSREGSRLKSKETTIHERFQSLLTEGLLEILRQCPDASEYIDDKKVKLSYGKSLRYSIEVNLEELTKPCDKLEESLVQSREDENTGSR